ncbi:helix-turn-helix domain-containing protein [Natronorubrum halophilum]|uniref:helix-turn-helix domain-containing protein n=1 Tax=Natronorubrum halophilum TaxID=1702106 RepID=UPI000EF6D1C4|nr:bacterio-opsin activator domain-containing protein [Natronorubrum halophilum]
MSILATITVPAAEFPLGSPLELDEDVTLTVETTVPTSEGVIPYFWAPADVVESIVDSLEEDPVVSDASVVDETDEHALIKVTWTDRVNGVIESIREQDVIVTSATGTETRWTFRLRFPSYEDLSAFYTDCVDQGISVELVQLHETVSPSDDRRFGLTAAQRDLIVAADDAGYFDVPRRTTLVELGDQLDISDSAVSQRLRRGLTALINSTVAADSASDEFDPSPRRPEHGSESERQSDAERTD